MELAVENDYKVKNPTKEDEFGVHKSGFALHLCKTCLGKENRTINKKKCEWCSDKNERVKPHTQKCFLYRQLGSE
jgi:hypothetical protein